MLSATSCPDGAMLALFGEGRLAAAMMDDLAGHVESCSSCVQSLHRLSSSDALAASLRDLHANSSPTYGNVGALVERLGQAADAARETIAPEQGTNSSAGGSDARTEEILRLLAPAQGAEELGRLGPYRVLAALGVGGMGAVFRVEDDTLRRAVALKVMLPKLAALPEARRRFLREARAMAAVMHDHIVPVFGVGEASGTPYLAMPLLEGESLESRLRRDPSMAVGEVVRLGRQVALGLAAAHEKGLIHRDIKPANIWLEALPGETLPRVKLLDFGLVRSAHGDDDGGRTEEGMLLGTPLYMAPEQAGGEVDQRADLFSLGCVLYQLATGRLPFTGNGMGQILRNVAVAHPPAPHTINPLVPIRLSRLIQALMAKEPQERPSSARLVARALEDALAPVAEVVTLHDPATPSRPASDPVAKPAAKRRWPTGVAVATAVMLLGLGVLTAVVFKVKTKEGVLVVEVNEPNAEVFVDGERATVTWGDGGKRAEIRLKPGTKKVQVKKDGFTTVGEEVTIEDGDRKVFSTRLERPAAPPTKTLAPDRKAAEWVLSIGGEVRVNGQDRDIKAIADLPKEVYRLTGVILHHKADDAGLAHLKDCKNLTYLDLSDSPVSNAGLAHLANCTSLTSVHLGHTKVSDAGLAHLKDCKNLTTVNLYCAFQVGDAGLAHLDHHKNLTLLDLTGTKVTDAGLAHLENHENLMSLVLAGTQVSSAGLVHLKNCKNLNQLDLNSTKVDDAGLIPLKAYKNLYMLLLAGTKVSDGGMAHLKDYKCLKHLRLDSTQVSNVGLARLAGCKHLRFLNLANLQVDDATLRTLLEDHPLLTDILLDGTKVSDAGLAHLEGCKNLTLITLQRTTVTAAKIDALKKALPNCKIYWDGGVIEPRPSPGGDSDRKAAE